MSDDKRPEPGDQNVGAASREDDRRVRALKWIGGIVAAGVAGAIATLIVSGGSSLTDLFENDHPPLHVVVVSTSPSPDCEGGLGWVFPRSPGALPLPPRVWPEGGLDRWAHANGGITASGNYVEVELQGRAQQTVVITDLRVRVVERKPAPRGSFPRFVIGCGGVIPSLYEADLDRAPVHVRPVRSDDDSGTPGELPASLPRRISDTDPEVWRIRTTTETCSCAWVAEVDWVSDGRRGTLTIDDDGEPFHVASEAHSVYVEQRESGRWIEVDAPNLSIEHRRSNSISQVATVRPGDAVRLSASGQRVGRLMLFAQPLASDASLRRVASAHVHKWDDATFVRHPRIATRYRVSYSVDAAKMSEPATVRVKDPPNGSPSPRR